MTGGSRSPHGTIPGIRNDLGPEIQTWKGHGCPGRILLLTMLPQHEAPTEVYRHHTTDVPVPSNMEQFVATSKSSIIHELGLTANEVNNNGDHFRSFRYTCRGMFLHSWTAELESVDIDGTHISWSPGSL